MLNHVNKLVQYCYLKCKFFFTQVVGEEKMGPVAWFIPIFVACSTFGCVNGLAFSGAR